MITDFQVHARALQELESRLGGACPVVTWNNADYQIIPQSAATRQDLVAGGFQLNADLRFDALVSTFGFPDAATLKNSMERTPIEYLGDEYQVASVAILSGGLQVTIECVSISQRA